MVAEGLTPQEFQDMVSDAVASPDYSVEDTEQLTREGVQELKQLDQELAMLLQPPEQLPPELEAQPSADVASFSLDKLRSRLKEQGRELTEALRDPQLVHDLPQFDLSPAERVAILGMLAQYNKPPDQYYEGQTIRTGKVGPGIPEPDSFRVWRLAVNQLRSWEHDTPKLETVGREKWMERIQLADDAHMWLQQLSAEETGGSIDDVVENAEIQEMIATGVELIGPGHVTRDIGEIESTFGREFADLYRAGLIDIERFEFIVGIAEEYGGRLYTKETVQLSESEDGKSLGAGEKYLAVVIGVTDRSGRVHNYMIADNVIKRDVVTVDGKQLHKHAIYAFEEMPSSGVTCLQAFAMDKPSLRATPGVKRFKHTGEYDQRVREFVQKAA